jgi:PQQ-like domain
MAGLKKAGQTFAVFADPKTKKSAVIPSFEPAGVLNGVIAGVNGGDADGKGAATILIADAATSKITKQYPTGQARLYTAGHGVKRAYMSGNKEVGAMSDNVIYSVDIATGAVVPIKAQTVESQLRFACLGDQASAVVCQQGEGNSPEIIGIDDTTGKKTWGYTNAAANRVVPTVTAAFHGVVYGETQIQPVMLDAATGNDIPTGTPTQSSPSAGSTPSDGATPSDGSTPSDGATPTQDPIQGRNPAAAYGSDMSLYNNKPGSPSAVTKYGGAYLQATGDASYQTVLVALQPIA